MKYRSLLPLAASLLLATGATFVSPAAVARAGVVYSNDLEKEAVGALGKDFLVLDGGFAVQTEDGKKFIELPGAPLDSYGVLFGPTEAKGLSLTAKVFGTGKGRRFPVFGIGLNGARGYRIQVAPAKKTLELVKGDAVQASAPLEWASGRWTHLKIQVREVSPTEWRIEGRAWTEGSPEPATWTVSIEEKQQPQPGRAGLYGNPFSGTPIRYDDLVIATIAP